MKHTADQHLDQAVENLKSQEPLAEDVERSQHHLLAKINSQIELNERQLSVWQKLTGWLQEMLSFTPLKVAGSMGAVGSFAAAIFIFSASTQVSFASMAKELKQVHSMFYSATMTNSGQPLMDLKVYYRDSGQVRIENYALGNQTEPSYVNIMDVASGKGVMKLPQSSESVPFTFDAGEGSQGMREDPLYWRQLILEVNPDDAEPLGSQTFSGVELTGYLLKDSGIETRVWIDAESELPVIIHVSQQLADGSVGFEIKADVTYNQRFDDSLFELN